MTPDFQKIDCVLFGQHYPINVKALEGRIMHLIISIVIKTITKDQEESLASFPFFLYFMSTKLIYPSLKYCLSVNPSLKSS